MGNQLSSTIFKRSSTTYYFSSWFFPEPVRQEVFDLYAFVRTADDCVDEQPARPRDFYNLVAATERSWRQTTGQVVRGSVARLEGSAGTVDDTTKQVIDGFVRVASTRNIPWPWVRAFLLAMEADLYHPRYARICETQHYIYGSAEVIGLMLIRIFQLPESAFASARLLGRAMQYINMIRDVAQDIELGRIYLPSQEWQWFGLHELSEAESNNHLHVFERYLRYEIGRYRQWMGHARTGFYQLPRELRIPVKTASDMYDWTADQLWQQPMIVWHQKVKPSPLRVVSTALSNLVSEHA